MSIRQALSLQLVALMLSGCGAFQGTPEFEDKWTHESMKEAERNGPGSFISALEPDYEVFCTQPLATVSAYGWGAEWACYDAASNLLLNTLMIEAYDKAAKYQAEYLKYKRVVDIERPAISFFPPHPKHCFPVFSPFLGVHEPVSAWRIDVGSARVPSDSVAVAAYFCEKIYGDEASESRTWLSSPNLADINKLYGPQQRQKFQAFEESIIVPMRKRLHEIYFVDERDSREARLASTQVLYGNALKACRNQGFDDAFCDFMASVLEHELSQD